MKIQIEATDTGDGQLAVYTSLDRGDTPPGYAPYVFAVALAQYMTKIRLTKEEAEACMQEISAKAVLMTEEPSHD